MRFILLSLAFLTFSILPAQVGYPMPRKGWDNFKLSILTANPVLDSLLNKTGIFICSYRMQTDKRGNVTGLKLTDRTPIGGSLSRIISDSIRRKQWIIAAGKKKQEGVSDITVVYTREHQPLGPNNKDSMYQTNPGRVSVIPVDEDNADTEIPDSEAHFPGGEQKFIDFILSEFEYPKRCMQKKISGYVMVKFVINRDGKVKVMDIKNESENCPEFGTEAKRAVESSPRWIPGVRDGKYIRAWRQVPIKVDIN
ncbi:MAG: energy transducer TonB [Bacteroidia bacterium]|nr:energy transducer TonB [Bacteroidia bacterium]